MDTPRDAEISLLPDPPEPIVIVGPDGRRHVLRYRACMVPTGLLVSLREAAVKPGDGYEFAVLGDHDADVTELAAAARATAEAEIRRRFLRPGGGRAAWRLTDDQVAGRLEYDPDGGPIRAIVDGRPLTWEQIGETLAEYQGWRFRLILDQPAIDLR